MSYDSRLADRIQKLLVAELGSSTLETRKMFGGLCVMLRGHMVCGVEKEKLMLRVGPERYEECLAMKHASEMKFTGKALRGFLFISPAGTKTAAQLKKWLRIALSFNATLPEKAMGQRTYPDSTTLKKVKNFGPVTSSELASMGIQTIGHLRNMGFERACRAYAAYFPERLNANAFLGILCTLEDTVWTKATPAQRSAARAMVRELKTTKL